MATIEQQLTHLEQWHSSIMVQRAAGMNDADFAAALEAWATAEYQVYTLIAAGLDYKTYQWLRKLQREAA